MSHTPWTIQAVPHRNAHRKGFHYCIRDSRNICLAVVGEVDAATDGQEAESLAHLFRAAPKLLRALEGVVRLAAPSRSVYSELPTAAIDDAHEAIAEARGES